MSVALFDTVPNTVKTIVHLMTKVTTTRSANCSLQLAGRVFFSSFSEYSAVDSHIRFA